MFYEEVEKPAAFAREQEALAGKRILLVEDDPRIRSVIGLVLGKLGAQVLNAGDGVEAIEVLQKQLRRKEPVEHAIVDIMLPRMNGVGFLRYVRDNHYFRTLPVIIASGTSDERDLHECRCLGIDDFIPKPITINQLVNTLVKSILARNEVLIEDQVLEEGDPEFSQLGYPLTFGGFPRPKEYSLRPAFYRCPFCETTFTAPRLSNRALKPDYNDKLAIGLYSEGLEKDFIEYPLIDTIVCPGCLYGSDRVGFHRIWTTGGATLQSVSTIPTRQWEPVYFQLVNRMRAFFGDGMVKRQEIVLRAEHDGLSLFELATGDETIPRRPADAMVALELAAYCARMLAGVFRGEPAARLRHKLAGYKLKQFYIARLLAGKKPGPETVELIRQKRIRLMYEAMQALLAVNDIDFNVLDERLYCLTRRFHLADMLVPLISNREEAKKLALIRRKSFAEMRQLLVRARQAGTGETRRIERFLLPLENRMYELKKKEEAYRAKQQALQQSQR